MGDPHRLLSNLSDAEDLERDLLGSIQRIEPPADAPAEAWARLSAQIAAVALVGTVHGSAAAAAASSAGAPGAAASAASGFGSAALKVFGSKLVVGLALTGAALGGSALWLHVRSSQPRRDAPAALAIPAPSVGLAAALPASAELVTSDAIPESADSPAPPVRANSDQSRKDRLSAESALLTRARAELRRGDTGQAQQTLNQLRKKFPKGMLRQEREVLAIELLAARGNSEAARRRAQAFIAAYPKSPHSAQLSRFAEIP